MRRTNITKAIMTLGLALSGVLLFTQCEGPAGPAGQDANETCKQCHNDGVDMFKAKADQYAASGHATGMTAERASSGSCAVCHSHEGFMQFLETGEADSVTGISNPTQPGCRTCHHVHENYDTTDYALRVTDAVEIRISGETLDLGKGNICASCHQPRDPGFEPSEDGGNITLTSSRAGVHHGPQSVVVAGTIGVKFAGQDHGSSPHKSVSDGCVTCHMAEEAYGIQAGGHTFSAAFESHGHAEVNTAGCVACHSDEDALLTSVETLQHDVETLIDSLENMLITEGILNASSGLAVTDVAFSGNVASAYLNYNIAKEDASLGVHNPKYIKALLNGAITKLQSK